MAILTYPLNGITYDAEDVEVYMCTRTSGIFSADGHFPASVSGRTVSIGPGLAWIQNEEFHGKAIYNPETVDLTIAEADAYQDRIDRIVLQFDKLLNQTTLVVKQGTASSSPKAPDIERDSLIYELGLYTVNVKASTIPLTDADISCTFLDDSVCGIMMDAVTQIPTQELYDQWYAWFAQIQTDTETFETQFNLWFEQIQEEAAADMASYNEQFEVWMDGSRVTFDEWFDSVQDTLDSDTAGKLTNLVNDAQDTADEALEQLAKGIVTGFMTDEAEGDSEYALQPDDNDENYGITISRPICDCQESISSDMISDEFNSNYTYKAGDYCIYDDTLWVFTSDKPAGDWDYTYVQMTSVGAELSSRAAETSENKESITTAQKTIGSTDISDVGDGTLTGAVSELNTSLADLLKVQSFTSETYSVNASSNTTASIDISLDGYTPLGIVTWTNDGSGTSNLNVYGITMDSAKTTISYAVRNIGSSTVSSFAAKITVLYMKNI